MAPFVKLRWSLRKAHFAITLNFFAPLSLFSSVDYAQYIVSKKLKIWIKHQYLRRPIGSKEKLSRFLTLKRSIDQRASVHSCCQTLINTAIVVMKDTLGLFFAKIDLSAMQILCYSIIPETLFIMISKQLFIGGLPREMKFTGTVLKMNLFL